jgi:hypothetical protein
VELAVNEGNQLVESSLVAFPPLEEELGYVRGMVRNAAIL